MKTAFIALLALVLIGGGYYWYSQPEMSAETPMMTDNNDATGESTDETGPAPETKINIEVVCEGALAYMSFPDGDSADEFVAECKAGEHPEVIERYKAEMNPGAGAEI
ncbi:hypothetical protein A2837_02120 [Candidatus Kaiserbacteria bacterium RIFCSPHIGHO2_01_FULL_46_22]|uniref:Uncharacterized protein n=1 Tax=Candidatus Kaiserbacteria bacterium RIFCSPHIGHO2_01_FULL_46_22 TaxID=1798475 RepID=A0A1F6BYX7_9BACT|nr:MAG: hypothetical protein A2837_02120 [Candidatus Kaiserbacteria bacterium RIFCSPHIGHO2_01_FULL_46_22]